MVEVRTAVGTAAHGPVAAAGDRGLGGGGWQLVPGGTSLRKGIDLSKRIMGYKHRT